MLRGTALAIVLSASMAASSGGAWAQAKVPTTPEEHLALAKKYQEQADAARKEAALHRQMAEAAKRSALNAHEKRGQKDPSVAKMEKHCAGLYTAAEKLAADTQKAADYHVLRAKELQGQ